MSYFIYPLSFRSLSDERAGEFGTFSLKSQSKQSKYLSSEIETLRERGRIRKRGIGQKVIREGNEGHAGNEGTGSEGQVKYRMGPETGRGKRVALRRSLTCPYFLKPPVSQPKTRSPFSGETRDRSNIRFAVVEIFRKNTGSDRLDLDPYFENHRIHSEGQVKNLKRARGESWGTRGGN